MLGEPRLIRNTNIQKLFTSFQPFKEGLESSETNWMNKPLLPRPPTYTKDARLRQVEGKQMRGDTPISTLGSQEKRAASVDVAASNHCQNRCSIRLDSPHNWIPSLPPLGHVLLESDWNCLEILSWKGKAVGRHPVCPGSLRSLTNVAPFWAPQFQWLRQPSASQISLCLACARRSPRLQSSTAQGGQYPFTCRLQGLWWEPVGPCLQPDLWL